MSANTLIRAAELLDECAAELRGYHTLSGDWGDEDEARESHDEMLAVADELRAMIAASPTPPEAPGWRPIETAPKDGTSILLLTPRGIGGGYWQQNDWHYRAIGYSYDEDDGPVFGCRPTHWMPLPPAPGAPTEQPAQPAQAFGVIDPDYARILTQARVVAWQFGYACVAHGSFTRDLDLLLVPWADRCIADASSVVGRIADVCGLQVQGPPSEKPHGRRAWSLLLPGESEVRWVDVSAMRWTPRCEQPAGPAEVARPVTTQAARDVLAERQRQIDVEGFTPENDDEHNGGELAAAAACYATAHMWDPAPAAFPLGASWWKPKDRRSNLVRAAALILAEIERIDRAALAAKGASHG